MNTKIQFWNRAQVLVGGMEQLAQYLVSVGLITEAKVKTIFAKPEAAWAAETYLMLSELSAQIPFMDYEWSLLPHEHLRFTIITQNSSKVISWPS